MTKVGKGRSRPSQAGKSPFLTRVTLRPERIEPGRYPFTIPLLDQGLDLEFSTPVTFLVGENGSGKSTVLEGLASAVGFNPQGGSRDHTIPANPDGNALGR